MRWRGRLDGGAPPPGRRRYGSTGPDAIGKAVIEYENGSRYEGAVVDGNPHGLGTTYRADDTIEREGNGVTESGTDWGRGTTGMVALHIALAGGGDLYLAGTTSTEIEAETWFECRWMNPAGRSGIEADSAGGRTLMEPCSVLRRAG